MKFALYTTAALSVLAAATAVQAQEAADWTGAYVGAHAGYGWHKGGSGETIGFDTNLDGTYGDTVRTSTGADAFSPGFCNGVTQSSVPGSCSGDDDGFEFGGRAGYDWQMGSFVIGGLVEATRTDIRDGVTAFSTTPAYYSMDRKLKGMLAARARLGFAMDRNLIYATGGYAKADVQRTFATSNAANTFVTSEDKNLEGWQLGAGVERKFTPNITVGLEYVYTRLDDDDYSVRATGPAPATNPFILVNADGTDMQRGQDEFNVHSVRLTTAYRF